ncbi:response regulator [Roseibium sp.]|uniref:response regulator n=1 Tax=Roseibium sp. TaxID=1936156 RepID=UPI0032672FA0
MSEKATILCVEDEAMLLEDLKEELEDAGYRVLTAENGTEAMRILRKERPNLILCDMMMPRMDGPTMLKHIRTNHPKLSDVPFVFLTAKATREDLIEGKRLGVDDYLTKPVDYDLLLATVEASLGQIHRIEERNKQKLVQLYNSFQKQRPSTSDKLRVSFVTSKPTAILPLTNALAELGCEVSMIPEEQLAQKDFSVKDIDILFLVYSRIVHYYLKFVVSGRPKNWQGEMVLLAPQNFSPDQKSSLSEGGIEDYIEYPYPPVEIFKLVLKRIQNGGKAAQHSSAGGEAVSSSAL